MPLNNYPKAVQGKDAYRHSELPNLNLLDRQFSLNSFEPLRPDGFERFTKLLNDSLSLALLRAAAVNKVIGGDDTTDSAPRVWIAPIVVTLADANALEKAMNDKNWNPEETAFITAPLTPMQAEGKKPGDKGATAQIVQENPLHLEIAADSPQSGVLIVADTYYPGWHATVDGQAAEIYRANLNFRGIYIPAGKHTITMAYEPQSWRTGAIVSAISLGIFLILLTAAFILRRRGTT